jgi:hypothetical protein
MTAIHEPSSAANDGMRQFGAPPDPRAEPSPTSGLAVHAVVLDADRILVVDDGVHCHLPGGQVPPGVDMLDALQARVHASTGHDLVGAVSFQRARRWTVDEEGRAVNEECHFYLASLGDRTTEPLPAGGTTRWAPRDAALDLMADEASRWVLSVVLLATAITGGLGARRQGDLPLPP